MSEKYKKTCKYLNYVKYLLILASTITACVSISAFASLICVPSTHNEGKSVTAERFIKTFKAKIYKKNQTKNYSVTIACISHSNNLLDSSNHL